MANKRVRTPLAWSGANYGLKTAGIADLRVGVPFAYNIRQHVSGTGAGTATLSLVSPIGDDPKASGFSISGDNLLYKGVKNASGSFRLRATYGSNIANTTNIDWAATGETAGEVPVPGSTTDRKVWWTCSFESGQILSEGASPRLDSGWMQTNTEPYGAEVNGVPTARVRSGQGGFGPSSPFETRVVKTDTAPTVDGHPGEAVVSRTGAGDYFLRGQISRSKDYREDVGADGYGKPRFILTYGPNFPIPDTSFKVNSKGKGIAVDEIWWMAYSMYVPVWYPTDRGGPHADARTNNTFDVLLNNGSASNSLIKFKDDVGDSPSGVHKMYATYKLCATSIRDDGTGATDMRVDIGNIADMRGHWVDFALRVRENPFNVIRNPATGVGGPVISGAINHTFAANTGILELWWRIAGTPWARVLNIQSKPVGMVPAAAYSRLFSPRHYKHGWLKTSGSPAGPPSLPARAAKPPIQFPPPTFKGDVYLAWDEIRFGYERLGTTLADVTPG